MTMDQLKSEVGLPVVIVDRDGSISYVNKRFETIFGWKPEEIVGQPLTIIIPKNLHAAHHLGFSRFLLTEQPTLLNQPLKLKAVTKDGKEFDSEHIIMAEQQEGRWAFGATIRPLE
jgi:PAS domain S-box-containing protein